MSIITDAADSIQRAYEEDKAAFIPQYEEAQNAAAEKQLEIQTRGSITFADFPELEKLYEINRKLEAYHSRGDLTEYDLLEFEIIFERP